MDGAMKNDWRGEATSMPVRFFSGISCGRHAYRAAPISTKNKPKGFGLSHSHYKKKRAKATPHHHHQNINRQKQ